MPKKRAIGSAANQKLIFAVIVVIALAAFILSTNSSITGNVFAKTISKASIITSISNGTGNSSNATSSAASITPIFVIVPVSTGESMLVHLEGVRRYLTVGETWRNFAFGYDIQAMSIDARASPRQALIAVYKNGILKDDAIANEGQYYDYVEDYMGYDNLIIFRINMSRIFAGATSDMIDMRDNYASSVAINACNPQWDCWISECLNYKLTRQGCQDLNSCHKTETEPAAIEDCQANKTLGIGESWSMLDGEWRLLAVSIDTRSNPKQAMFTLSSAYGYEDSKIVNEGELYEFAGRWIGYDNITIFSTKVDSIYAGATTDLVRLKDAFLSPATLCVCEQLWRCGAWSSCINGRKTRTCTDQAGCSSSWSAYDLGIGCDSGMPLTSISCGPSVSLRRASVNLTASSNASNVSQAESENASAAETGQNQTVTIQANNLSQSSDSATMTVEAPARIETEGQEDNAAETQLDAAEESNSLIVSEREEKKQITLPEDAISEILESRVIERIVSEKEDGKIIYRIYTTKKVKVLLVFDASLNEEIKIDAENGEIIEIKSPWWKFLSR